MPSGGSLQSAYAASVYPNTRGALSSRSSSAAPGLPRWGGSLRDSWRAGLFGLKAGRPGLGHGPPTTRGLLRGVAPGRRPLADSGRMFGRQPAPLSDKEPQNRATPSRPARRTLAGHVFP